MTMNGYHFECACGERYNTVRAAVACRKCRAYCVFGYCTHVTDLRNGKVVHGEVPSNADHAAAVAEYEAYRAIEAKELEYERQMWIRKGELYEAQMTEWREEAAAVAKDLAEDQIWDLQDNLMGY